MSGFDANLHQKFADMLRLRAKRITLVYTAMAGIVGAGLGVALPRMMGQPSTKFPIILWTALLAVFGFVAGKERSFNLGVKANELLWQKQLEENTRKADMASSATAK